MSFTFLDGCVVAGYFVVNILIGIWYRRKATRSTEEYFVGGRQVNWLLAGTSMVATTFAADTPLAVTGLVAAHGIAGNWLWWSMCLSNVLTVFFFARLWRRSEVMTDVEFTEIRYGGKPAAFLRVFRAIYLAIPINCVILGWVNLAMVKILAVIFPIDKIQALEIVFGMMLLTTFISSISGLWGVLVTDAFQFVLMMGMMILLAYFAVHAAGGITGLKAKLLAIDVAHAGPVSHSSILNFVPEIGSAWMPMLAFFMYIAVNWWATWYPGSEPGGGGYIAQRMFSAKDERHSLLATLWFTIAHYAIRPWPWILTALASLVLYPGLEDKESGFVRVLMDPNVFPIAFRGLMIAAFAAAYMSTISTQLNWGASYLVNDVYRRFLNKGASERHCIRVSQIATLGLMAVSVVVTYYQDSISGAWKFLIAVGAGTGSVFILRWFWWRINAWSEIVAMAASFIASIMLQNVFGLKNEDPREFALSVLFTVAFSTIAWLTVTLATRPEDPEKLRKFYRKVRPHPALWGPIARAVREQDGTSGERDALRNAANWGLGVAMVYGTLFGVGKLIFGEIGLGLGLAALALASGALLYRNLRRIGWKVASD
jgi:Na+/proline symporter